MKLTNIQIRLIMAVALSFSMLYAEATVMSIALPHIQSTFSVTTSKVLWVVNIFMLARATLTFVSGKISDLFSHKKTFLIGLIISALSSLGCAFSSSIDFLIFFRCLQGISASFILISGMSLITHQFPIKQRGRITSIVLSIGLGSMAAGPVWGGLMIHYASWHWIFLVNTFVIGIAFILTMRLPKYPHETNAKSSFDWLGTVLTAIFTLGMNIGFINSQSWGWLSAKFITCMIIALIALVLFIWLEPYQESPLIDFKLFKLPNYKAGTIISGLNHVSIIFILFIGIFLQNRLGYSSLKAGLSLLPLVVTGVIFTNVGGYLTDKFNPRVPSILGTGCAFVGFLLTLIFFNDKSYYILLPMLIGSGLGCFMISSPIRLSMINQAKKTQYGMVNAMLTGIRSIISLIGFSITSAIITNTEFHLAKIKLIKIIPTISIQQIHGLLGLLANTHTSKLILQQFDQNLQTTIRHIILASYSRAFFWALFFIGSLMLINFIISILFIKIEISKIH